MKILFTLFYFIIIITPCSAQEFFPEENEYSIAQSADDLSEADEFLEQRQGRLLHPLDINRSSEDELLSLGILTELQVQNFILYRSLLGDLIDQYEMQAIPGWDLTLISKLKNFITISDRSSLAPATLLKQWEKGENNLLIRTSGNGKIFSRYLHTYSNKLDVGITMEKDSGEKLFDFFSVHVFIRSKGFVRKLAFGDFVVSLSQGLVMGQGLPLKKSANVLAIKKQGETLRPYRSSGEYNFRRGAAITVGRKNWESSFFISARSLDGNVSDDSLHGKPTITSIGTSGLHIQPGEKSNRNTLFELAVGGCSSFQFPFGKVQLNMACYKWSLPLKKTSAYYNRFAFEGDKLCDASIAYSKTYRNVHLFGEFSMDSRRHTAMIHGLVASLHRNLDLSFHFRKLDPGYSSFYTSSFAENSTPANETGFYAGISWKFSSRFQLSAYVDKFQFPYLKYQAYLPEEGSDKLVQLVYSGSKTVEITAKCKMKRLNDGLKCSNQFQVLWSPTKMIQFRQRIATSHNSDYEQGGAMAISDIRYKPGKSRLSLHVNMIFFDSGSPENALYAYEPDVLFHGNLLRFSGSGHYEQLVVKTEPQQFINILKKINCKAEFWVAVSQLSNYQYFIADQLKVFKPGKQLKLINIQVNFRW